MKLLTVVVPFYMETSTRKIDPGLGNARHRLQAVLDQPDTGGAVDTFDEKMNIPNLAKIFDIFLLNLVQVVEIKLPGKLRWRAE